MRATVMGVGRSANRGARRRWVVVAAWLGAMALPAPAWASPGDLDTSFGGNGKVQTNFTPSLDEANDVALQADGKIVAVGAAAGRFAAARYHPDGTLDDSFSGNGKVRTNFTDGADRALGVAIQPNGKIVVAGISDTGRNARFALARYRPDGSLDSAFSGNGKVTTNFTPVIDGANDVALQDDGRIVAAGIAGSSLAHAGTFALARYGPLGRLDKSFSGNGKVRTNFTADFDGAFGLAIQENDKIVAAGVAVGHDAMFALARYRPDGALDPNFSGNGKVVTNFSPAHDQANDLAIQLNGRIVAAGQTRDLNWAFALARYRRDGTLDDSFSGNGKVKTRFSPGIDQANDVAIQDDGKVVAVGGAEGDPFNPKFALARYKRGGALDDSFGGNGKVQTDFTDGRDEAKGVVIQPDGRIVAAGVGDDTEPGQPKFALARYLAA